MRILIDIQPPIPPSLDQSYFPFKYYNFGVCCWVYDGYDGAIEWINTEHFCTEPKYEGPTAFRYYMKPGVQALVQKSINVSGAEGLDFVVNNLAYNAATGKGFPLPLF